MTNKKSKQFLITGITLLCSLLAVAFAHTNASTIASYRVGANDSLKTMTFNGDNHAPTMSTGYVLSSFDQKFDYNGNVDNNGGIQLHYTNCKYNTNQPSYHVRLVEQNNVKGTIEKTDETYDIRTFTVTFGGSDSSGKPVLRLYYSKTDANSDYSLETNYKEIQVTSGTEYDVFGYNYWKIINSGTTNIAFSYTFGCKDRSNLEDVKVSLNENLVFYEGGRMPTKDDFTVTATYDIGGVSYEQVMDTNALNINVPNDFLTNGGDIGWSYLGHSGTVKYLRSPLLRTEDVKKLEAEDANVTGATSVTQLKEYPHDEETGYIKSGELVKGEHYSIGGASLASNNELMLACAYLDYANTELASSASDEKLGGLVTYMDASRNGKITFSQVTCATSGYYVLTVRGASNKELTSGSSTMADLKITSNVTIKVNSNNVNSLLDKNAYFPGSTNSSSSEYNRNYTAGLNLNLRYKYIHWATAELGAIYLYQGTNNIEIIGATNSSGNWDYIELTRLESNSEGEIYECELADLDGGAKYLRQISNKTDYTTFASGVDYLDNCDYGQLHAKAYLGYQGTKYGSHGSNGDYGGFVHYFNAKSTITFTIESEEECVRQLVVRGSTNVGANTSNHTISNLYLYNKVNISVNDEDLYIKSTLYFEGKDDTIVDESANRTGTVGSSSLSGRYVYLLWREVGIGEIHLKKGTNTIVITGKAQDAGHWDYIKLV